MRAEASGDTADGTHVEDRPKRSIAARLTTVLAALLVLLVLTVPYDFGRLSPAAFARIPLEALLVVALLLALPSRGSRLVATLAGVALGLLGLLKLLDLGFTASLSRAFDPVLDWALLDEGFAFLSESYGRPAAIGVAITLAVVFVGLPTLVTLSMRRLRRLVVRHRTATTRIVAALVVVWVACAAFNVRVVEGVPVADTSATTLTNGHGFQVRLRLDDRERFAALLGDDRFADTPGDQLLTALRGKNVVISFVESYGRDAVEDPEFAPQVGAVLDGGTSRLNAAGFAAQSGFLTSPTFGGGSWLAHDTLLSGLWVDNDQRHRTLLASDRMTLNGAFRRADWQTVGVMPAVSRAWPEGSFFGYERFYDARALGYRGPKFSFGTHARPVHPRQLAAPGAGEARRQADDDGTRAGVESRALDARPGSGRLGSHRQRGDLQGDRQGVRRQATQHRADPRGLPALHRVHVERAHLVRADLRRR